jgi:hypothetical protein
LPANRPLFDPLGWRQSGLASRPTEGSAGLASGQNRGLASCRGALSSSSIVWPGDRGSCWRRGLAGGRHGSLSAPRAAPATQRGGAVHTAARGRRRPQPGRGRMPVVANSWGPPRSTAATDPGEDQRRVVGSAAAHPPVTEGGGQRGEQPHAAVLGGLGVRDLAEGHGPLDQQGPITYVRPAQPEGFTGPQPGGITMNSSLEPATAAKEQAGRWGGPGDEAGGGHTRQASDCED